MGPVGYCHVDNLLAGGQYLCDGSPFNAEAFIPSSLLLLLESAFLTKNIHGLRKELCELTRAFGGVR